MKAFSARRRRALRRFAELHLVMRCGAPRCKASHRFLTVSRYADGDKIVSNIRSKNGSRGMRAWKGQDLLPALRQAIPKPEHSTLRSWQPKSAACPFPIPSSSADRWAKANPELARKIPYFQNYFFLSEDGT